METGRVEEVWAQERFVEQAQSVGSMVLAWMQVRLLMAQHQKVLEEQTWMAPQVAEVWDGEAGAPVWEDGVVGWLGQRRLQV